MGNLVTGTDAQTTMVIQSGALEKIVNLLSHEKRAVRREACWTLSNITAGSPDQIALVVRTPGYIEKLLTLINSDSAEIKREASWVISNATARAAPEDMLKMVDIGVLDTFVGLLNCDDVKTVAVVLEAIKNILSCGAKHFVDTEKYNIFLTKFEQLGGVAKLESLQVHPNEEIYEKTVAIIEANFDLESPI